MKLIKLTNGGNTLVDNENFEELSKQKWYRSSDAWHTYARETTQSAKLLHDILMKPPKGMFVDHIDGNGLNNQKKNLRVCNLSENSANRILNINNTSGFKGVHWHKGAHKWVARINFKYKRYTIGYFKDIIEAAKAYNEAAKKYFGDYAKLNKI